VAGLLFLLVAAVHCRNTGRRVPRTRTGRGLLVASIVGLAGITGLGGSIAPVGATSTTLPGPAPNQAQINATKSKVAQIEATLAQEVQQTSILDDRYNTAVQNLQDAQKALQGIDANLARTRAQIKADRKRLANDVITSYIYGTSDSRFSSFFSQAASMSEARDEYTNEIVGNLSAARTTLQSSEAQLQGQEQQRQADAAKAQAEAAQAKSLAAANQQEAAAARATLSQVQGQLAQQVAQAAVLEAQQQAAAAARAASAAQAQKATAAAAAAAAVAGAVGGASGNAAATAAANQASGGGSGAVGPVGGTGSGTSQQMAAVHAAVSQLGVPYVFGGESQGVGFDCSGLVQWAWGQAGVSIPRTTETQWPALRHVSLSALEPGDLLFYYNLDGDSQVDHVVMYTGSGPYGTDTVIQAPFTGSTVSYSPIFTGGLIGAGRP
jgi:cell wall-associated NlpC family hydrolase